MPEASVEYTDLAPVLLGDQAMEIQDPEAIKRAITERILLAETAEEIFAPVGTTSAEDVAGIPITINAVRWNKSTFDEGPGLYCLIDATAADGGEHYTISCGSVSVMAKLYRAAELKVDIPTVMIVKAKTPTAAGFFPLDLVAA